MTRLTSHPSYEIARELETLAARLEKLPAELRLGFPNIDASTIGLVRDAASRLLSQDEVIGNLTSTLRVARCAFSETIRELSSGSPEAALEQARKGKARCTAPLLISAKADIPSKRLRLSGVMRDCSPKSPLLFNPPV